MPPTIVPPFAGRLESTALNRVWNWRSLVAARLRQNGTGAVLSVPVVLGLIYAESRGSERAASGPVSDWFSSFGLMQVNAQEHWRSTGRPIEQLFDPNINVEVGTKILARAIRTWGGVDAGVAAYNSGSGRRQPRGTRFCLVWRSGTQRATRSLMNDCDRMYMTQKDGEFGNQPYVDEVLAAANYFRDRLASEPPANVNAASVEATSEQGWLAALVAALGAAWYAVRGKGTKRGRG